MIKYFFHKIPRVQIYLDLSDLISVFFKTLFSKLERGQKTEEFENAFKSYYQVEQAVVLSQARIALYYILKNLNLSKGDQVLMTPLTIADMVNMIQLLDLEPVFCDLAKQTYNIDCQDLESKITDKTKVLFVTHLNGLSTDMDKIKKIVNEHDLVLIEDCSQSFGAKFKDKYLGTFGQASIFSLSVTKTCSTLFGGMIISNDSELVRKITDDTKDFNKPKKSVLISNIIKNLILKIATNRFIFSVFTYYLIYLLNLMSGNLVNRFVISNPNTILKKELDPKILFHYTDLQAKIGIKVLKIIDQDDQKRIDNVQFLFNSVSSKVKDRLPVVVPGARNVYWRMPIRVSRPKDFIRYMSKKYIDTVSTNLVLASQEPAFEKYKTDTPEAFESKFNSVFVPIHSSFSRLDIKYIAEALNSYFKDE